MNSNKTFIKSNPELSRKIEGYLKQVYIPHIPSQGGSCGGSCGRGVKADYNFRTH